MHPLAFCRELCRGGKPQFFFEIDLDIRFEELKGLIRERASLKNEFKGPVIGLTLAKAKTLMNCFSHELNAFILLKS